MKIIRQKSDKFDCKLCYQWTFFPVEYFRIIVKKRIFWRMEQVAAGEYTKNAWHKFFITMIFLLSGGFFTWKRIVKYFRVLRNETKKLTLKSPPSKVNLESSYPRQLIARRNRFPLDCKSVCLLYFCGNLWRMWWRKFVVIFFSNMTNWFFLERKPR